MSNPMLVMLCRKCGTAMQSDSPMRWNGHREEHDCARDPAVPIKAAPDSEEEK